MSDYGSAVQDGDLHHFSASNIACGDNREYGGCEQRFVFKYREHRHEPETHQNRTGIEVHEQVEEYLPTGRMVLGPIAMSMRPYLPKPGPDILVEQQISGYGPTEQPWLTLDGVPFVGKIDFEHDRCVSINGPEDEINDPPGTVEIGDNKTTSSLEYAKAGADLIKTVQMVTYGEAVSRRRALNGHEPSFVRLSHVIGRTRGARAAKKATMRHTRAEIAVAFREYVVPAARRVRELARGATPVPNLDSCGAWGGCPHKTYCPAYQSKQNESSLEFLIGPEPGETMSNVLDFLNPAAITPDSAAVEKAKADLAAREAAALAKVQAEAQAALETARATVPREFVRALDIIDRAKLPNGTALGRPAMNGRAAELVCNLNLQVVPAGGTSIAATAGSPAAGMPAQSDPAEIVKIADELIQRGFSTAPPDAPAPAAQATAAILPPDAPVSKPELAADPVPGFNAPATDMRPPVTPASSPAEEKTEPAPAEKPKRGGRPKGSKNKTEGDALEIYVNAIPNRDYQDLRAYINGIAQGLAEKASVPDVRMASGDHVMAFGRWRGFIAAQVKKTPPPKGCYVIIAPDEICDCALEALAEIADEFVRGVR